MSSPMSGGTSFHTLGVSYNFANLAKPCANLLAVRLANCTLKELCLLRTASQSSSRAPTSVLYRFGDFKPCSTINESVSKITFQIPASRTQ
ncbi:hypothetical protein Syun_003799 [Stephania yunnanensis]|uniref:Uncharacterized protein n=1 Tax=Stephania yunnanensis TaxID=152371 RepID=A0AAP0L1T2_9MAGN